MKDLGKDQSRWPFAIRGDFSGIDIMNTADFGNLAIIFNQDIYILSYIISEIFQDLEILDKFTARTNVGTLGKCEK
jgi:hypothetical protein